MNTISTQSLKFLPKGLELQNLCKSISALEAILCPEWQGRYYSYNKNWSDVEEFCKMRDGQGDEMNFLFSPNGVVINGFAHESEMNQFERIETEKKKTFIQKLLNLKGDKKVEPKRKIWDGVVDDLPDEFKEFIFGEPVKSIGTTFCIWQTNSDEEWQTGKIDYPPDSYKDGSSDLLQLLDGNPMTFKIWAIEYYELWDENFDLDIKLIEFIYDHKTITRELVSKLNPNIESLEKLKVDLEEIGYPCEL